MCGRDADANGFDKSNEFLGRGTRRGRPAARQRCLLMGPHKTRRDVAGPGRLHVCRVDFLGTSDPRSPFEPVAQNDPQLVPNVDDFRPDDAETYGLQVAVLRAATRRVDVRGRGTRGRSIIDSKQHRPHCRPVFIEK